MVLISEADTQRDSPVMRAEHVGGETAASVRPSRHFLRPLAVLLVLLGGVHSKWDTVGKYFIYLRREMYK